MVLLINRMTQEMCIFDTTNRCFPVHEHQQGMWESLESHCPVLIVTTLIVMPTQGFAVPLYYIYDSIDR